jgi:hypothetical protein
MISTIELPHPTEIPLADGEADAHGSAIRTGNQAVPLSIKVAQRSLNDARYLGLSKKALTMTRIERLIDLDPPGSGVFHGCQPANDIGGQRIS